MRVYFEVKGGLKTVIPGGFIEISNDTSWNASRFMELIAINDQEVGIIILNGKVVKPDHPVSDGDKILFFPMIYGG